MRRSVQSAVRPVLQPHRQASPRSRPLGVGGRQEDVRLPLGTRPSITFAVRRRGIRRQKRVVGDQHGVRAEEIASTAIWPAPEPMRTAVTILAASSASSRARPSISFETLVELVVLVLEVYPDAAGNLRAIEWLQS